MACEDAGEGQNAVLNFLEKLFHKYYSVKGDLGRYQESSTSVIISQFFLVSNRKFAYLRVSEFVNS